MTNKSEPAFPCVGEGFGNPNYHTPGLTKREYFAAMAMQGLLADGEEAEAKNRAKAAVYLADALIEELNK